MGRSTGATKWANVLLLVVAEMLTMGLWFSASAVAPQLTEVWSLDGAGRSWLTMSVQLGFVVGALASAVTQLADRVRARVLFAACAAVGAALNAAITLPGVGPEAAIVLRFLTGMTLAGVYPPGMKLVASWCREDRGLGIGLLVGAVTLGSSLPHLLNWLPAIDGMPPWRPVLLVASILALVGAALAASLLRAGPHLAPTAPFDWQFIRSALSHTPTRLANYGYLGHMWELYAMWAWVPICLLESYAARGMSGGAARLAGFAVIAVGAVGSVIAGVLADRLGRTRIAMASLAISGLAALVAGLLFPWPGILTVVCLIWGFAVVADSAQFSAAITELTDPRYVGTALTLQTCLGFLLTLFTLRLVPPLVARFGWEWAFPVLALGPGFGIWAMRRLRNHPESARLASGRR